MTEHADYQHHAQEENMAPGALFTCPMHPEIRQQGPGDCPICGMALKPEVRKTIERPTSGNICEMGYTSIGTHWHKGGARHG